MTPVDPFERTELTGPWTSFGFQQGHMWTPEGYSLYPQDMVWWSLTCNIAREWRLMMADERRARALELEGSGNRCGAMLSEIDLLQQPKIIYLRDVLRRRQQERSAG
ncbi:hypothetical protein [uncultured Xanthomonas sp.]|uniref:hypothetical protein n=1 Tax=uncultured Xanthomonas sp. TaxID=152831 RepID=UPI0025D1383B|nr:hypothetical protein [uncultured Xanthomonas sp.]